MTTDNSHEYCSFIIEIANHWRESIDGSTASSPPPGKCGGRAPSLPTQIQTRHPIVVVLPHARFVHQGTTGNGTQDFSVVGWSEGVGMDEKKAPLFHMPGMPTGTVEYRVPVYR